jgi:integrase
MQCSFFVLQKIGTAVVQKAPTLTDDIRAMVDATDAGLIGARDRAIILFGFAGAFRRSEIIGLNAEDCAFSKDGLTITLRRSKSDQEGVGRKIGIPYGSNPEKRAPFACCNRGWNRRAYRPGRCSDPSIGTGGFSRADCRVSTWRES